MEDPLPQPPGRAPVLVVGGGVSGLSAALLAARAGLDVELWEARSELGGMLAPIDFLGVPCDRGSHRVSPQADPLLRALTPDCSWRLRPRRGVLVLEGRQVPYPLTPRSLVRGLGLRRTLELSAGTLASPRRLGAWLRWDRHRGGEDRGFAAFVQERVGQEAYESFYAPYAEKVWGLPASRISQTAARQRVSTSSPWRSLAASQAFWYPEGGMAELLDSLHRSCLAAGVRVRTSKAWTGQTWPGPVLYSAPLPRLVPDSGLEHRGLYLLHLALEAGSVGQADTWYLPERRFWMGRVSRPAAFSPTLRPGYVAAAPGPAVAGPTGSAPQASPELLAVEIPEGSFGPDQDFTRSLPQVLDQLREAGVLRGGKLLAHRQSYLPGIYPLTTRGWLRDWRHAVARVPAGVYPFGRQGLFLHCNLDHCARMAQDLVDHLLRGDDSRSWSRSAERYLQLRVRD